MICYVYILKSDRDKGFYIGITKNFESRLYQHNRGYNKSTKGRAPFVIAHLEQYKNYADARKREKQLKSHGQIRERLLRDINFYGPIV